MKGITKKKLYYKLNVNFSIKLKDLNIKKRR